MNRSIKALPKKLSASKKPVVTVDSPLAKYDSAGTLTCIICRIPIKPNVWKVHINSKQHKANVDQAKQNKVDKPAPKAGIPAKESPAAPAKVQPPAKPNKAPQSSQVKPETLTGPEKPSQDAPSEKPAPEAFSDKLPEKFFDEDKASKAEAQRAQDEEWQRFQQEIKKAATESSVIVADEQEDINLKRHLKEIDEQMDNWKRFIKINDQKTVLLGKRKRLNPKVEIDPDLSSSEEDCSVDDLYDWRTKNLHS